MKSQILILGITYFILNVKVSAQSTEKDTLRDTEIETVMIVGNERKILPGSGQYIDIRLLEKINQTNVNNVLRVVPGVNIRDEEGFGLRPNIGLRGTQVNRSAKITLMEDGILIAPAPYADPSAYYFPTFARMHGIEVLKGSSQIKYGPYTIGGAINLLTTPIPTTFQGFAQLSYGSFRTNQQRVWIGDNKKNIDYLFEINRIASNGFKHLDNGGNTGFDRRDIMGKIRWHSNEEAPIKHSLTLKFVNASEESNETYLGLTFNDYMKNPLRRYAGTQKDKLELNHQHLSLNHMIMLAHNLKIATTVYYSKTFRDWARANNFGNKSINNILTNPIVNDTAYNVMTGKADGNITYHSAARTYYAQGIQSQAQYLFNTGTITHKMQIGLRYHKDQADRYATHSTYQMLNGKMILTTAGIKGNQENQIRSAYSFATHFSYDLLYKGLKVSPGIRYERIHLDFKNYGNSDTERLGINLKTASNQLSILLPGLGINYDIHNDVNIFAGIHRGFSPPGMPSVSSTKQAKEEISTNYELGFRIEKNNFYAELVTFLNNYDNILGSDNVSGGGAGTGNMFNAGKAKIQGIESSLTYDWYLNKKLKKLKIPFSIIYTYTEAKFLENFQNAGGDWGNGTINKGDIIPFVSPHLLTFSTGIEHPKFNILIMARYIGPTRVKPGQGQIIFPNTNVAYNDINALKGYLILDGSGSYYINKIFTTFIAVNNVTNNQTIIANLPQGYRPNIPLSFNLGIKVKF